jgi:hypothetical protein
LAVAADAEAEAATR